jgi:molecular chaperone GrpE (heat shock protein)
MGTVANGYNGHQQLVQSGAQPARTELPDLLRRERADFLNYKRRVELERTLDREQASAAFIEKVLPLLDELDRAFDHLPAELEPHGWVRGVALAADASRRSHANGVSSVSALSDAWPCYRL